MKFIINIPKENLNKSGIYKIENNINDKIYIGSTKNFKHRANKHYYMIKNFKHNLKINILTKTNPDIIYTMSILELTNNYKELEFEYIKYYNTVNNGLNILDSIDGFYKFIKLKKEIKLDNKKYKILKPKTMKCKIISNNIYLIKYNKKGYITYSIEQLKKFFPYPDQIFDKKKDHN